MEPEPAISTPSSPTSPATPEDAKFKSMLQVLLKTRQDDELVKNFEYKEKIEKGEEDEEEEEGEKKRETEMEEGEKKIDKKERNQEEDGRTIEDKIKRSDKDERKEKEKENEGKKKMKQEGETSRMKDTKGSGESKETGEAKINKKHKDKETNKSKEDEEKDTGKRKGMKESKDKEENKNKVNKEKEKMKKKEKIDKDENKEENAKKENKQTEANNNKEKKDKEASRKAEKKQNEEQEQKEEEKKSKKSEVKKEDKENTKKKEPKKKEESNETKEEPKEKDKAKKREDNTSEKDTKKKEDKAQLKDTKREEKTEENDTSKKEEMETKKGEEKTKEKHTKKKEEKPQERDTKKKEEKPQERDTKKKEEKPQERDTKKGEEKPQERDTKKGDEKTKDQKEKAGKKKELRVPKIEVEGARSSQDSNAGPRTHTRSSSASSSSSSSSSTSTSPSSPSLSSKPTSPSDKLKVEEGGKAEEKVLGILYKKGKGPFGSWKRYFFVLKGQLLMYYYSEHDYKELASFKGSLDLTMLEDVSEKKRGFLKTHFPFSLSRRNLKHIVLAAETKEERNHWMSVLRSTLLRPTAMSGNRSDSNIPAPRGDETSHEKSATLPARCKKSPASSSASESEEEKEEKEKKKKEEEEEEEEGPKLIQPKKVQRIPINPMGQINIDAIKLKKIERRPSDDKKSKDQAEAEDKAEEPDLEAKFGVRLKKHSHSLSPALTARGDVGDEKEAKDTSLTPSLKRPNKNPIIPLGKSPLLSRPEGELLKTASPETHRRAGTPERKKSPSPSIPLSKGVHSVLAKSGEEGDEEDKEEREKAEKRAKVAVQDGVDASKNTRSEMKSSESSASESEEEETREETEEEEPKKIQPKTVQGIQLSPTIHLKDPDKSLGSKLKEPNLPGGGEKATAAKEGAPEDAERASDSASPETKEDSPSSFSLSSQGSLSRQGSEAEFLQVSVTLKENGGDESEYDQLDEDVLRNVKHSALPDASDKVTRDDELKRRDCEASPKRPTPSPVHHTPSTSGTSSPASVRALEENKKPKSPKQDSGSAGATPPRSPFRRRSNTNESSGSAKSETETPEKKSGKFKAMFARNRSGSLDVGRSDSVKGEYEVKGKNSSSFAKFLQRKMSKDKKENAKGESSGTEREDSSPETRKKSEIPKEAVPAETLIPQEAKVADAPSSPKKMVPTFNIVPALQEENESPEDVDDCATVTMRSGHQASGKSRGSTYSRSSNASREQEPPPMVPEKTRIREKSPVHDIPRSNKPVPAVLTIQKDEPQVVEDKVVDGNISLEQINAILSAKEIRNKKRLSREQEILLEGMGARRPSSLSTTSVESDEPLPKTNFIDCDISSSSSGSLRDQSRSSDSMGSSDHLRLSADLEAAAADVEAPVTLRKPKLTESLTAGPRVSLTQPEFTVVEEDLPAASPETERQARSDTPDDHPDGNDTDDHEEDEEDETSEQNDYFPVVGVEVRPPSPTNLKLPDSPTLGITRLKAYIDEMEEEDAKASSVRTGISRLGHSAAVEKLKEEITDEPPRE